MSFYDDASLVVIPSGFKTSKVYAQKPTDGSGDLAFTRTGDTATRVNSAGLVEKVRTNLIRQSESFNTTWTLDGATVTANSTTAPNGTLTADTITGASGNFRVWQNVTGLSSISYTFSVYAKKGTATSLSVDFVNVADGPSFNFDTKVWSVAASWTTSFQELANGWFRLFATRASNTSSAGPGFKVGGVGQTVFLWGAQMEATDVGTDYIPTTTAAVSVGPVANLPRLDYLGSTCPRLLLEPQRVNLQLNSEDFSQANWSKTNSAIVVNQVASPDGYVSADKFNETAVNSLHQLESTRSVSASTVYTMSVFAKKAERNFVRIYEDTNQNSAYFNLNTGAIGTVSGPTATAKIENYGNGWYRCSVTYTETGTSGRYRILVATADNTPSYLGVVNNGIYVWGAQYEAGAYATSYIPTLGATVTRGADAASKTGISSLIGQTEGVLFVDFTVDTISAQTNDPVLCYMKDGGVGERYVQLYSTGNLRYLENNGATIATITKTGLSVGRHKCAIAYANNDMVFYVDGVQIGTDTSGTPSGFSTFALQYYNAAYLGQQKVNQVLLFKTRLTNAQLAELTTL